MPKDKLRAVYAALVPSKLRYLAYKYRYPEHRFEERISSVCRKGVEDFLDSLAAEGILKGRILEVGAGGREVNKQRFASNSSLYCRSDLMRWPESTLDLISDCTNLAFRSGSLDGIICSEVLEHVPQIHKAVTELGRVLRSGGYLVVTMPFFYPLHGLDSNGHGDYWRLTPTNLKTLFAEHFEIVREGTSHLISPQDPFIVNQQLLLKRTSLAA